MGKLKEVSKKQSFARDRASIIELLQSGYAGLDRNGHIIDSREARAVKRFAENKYLSIPEPKK